MSVLVCFSKQRFATAGHGGHRGAAGSDKYVFRKCNAGSHIYLPRSSFRHVSDGIARIKNILKYDILMSVVLYISNDNTGTSVHIYILTMNYKHL